MGASTCQNKAYCLLPKTYISQHTETKAYSLPPMAYSSKPLAVKNYINYRNIIKPLENIAYF